MLRQSQRSYHIYWIGYNLSSSFSKFQQIETVNAYLQFDQIQFIQQIKREEKLLGKSITICCNICFLYMYKLIFILIQKSIDVI